MLLIVDKFTFSNTEINRACQQVENALVAYGVERREALRIRLTFEEILLEYQENLGAEAEFRVRCISRFSAIRVEVSQVHQRSLRMSSSIRVFQSSQIASFARMQETASLMTS